jgi:hypothetical protein
LGQLASLLESGPDAVVLSISKLALGPRESALLLWYLRRKLPQASLWLFSQGDEVSSLSESFWSEAPSFHRESLPAEQAGYLEWVERFRLHHRLDYQTGTLPTTWWRTRRWLVADGEGQEVASHGIDDPALMSDLLAFLRLKAGQMVEVLGVDRWRGFALSSDDTELEIAALESEHAVISLDDGQPAGGRPPSEETLQLLYKRGVVTPCH